MYYETLIGILIHVTTQMNLENERHLTGGHIDYKPTRDAETENSRIDRQQLLAGLGHD